LHLYYRTILSGFEHGIDGTGNNVIKHRNRSTSQNRYEGPLFPLNRGVTWLAIEGIEILGLDHIKASLIKALEERDDL
jgi:hypothetical protein